MNIKRAKEEIQNTVRAYLSKDELGAWRIPPVRQRPLLLMGPPGIGKTQIMEQIAAELGIGLVSYTITHHTRQSALGLPFIREETFGGQVHSVTEYTMSEILASVYRTMEETGIREGILFLDEINCISETLAPMMLQFLQCKTFGNQRLPEGWIIAAAGNPPEYNKSVREFDVVTLDRVKRMDITADYGVWKEYAQARGIHGAILSYLDLRKENFYAVERTADGLQFVTARGWEDLSELLLSYEALGIPADREVVGEYLQLPRIARDFAEYLALYDQYRKVYHVDEILSGQWSPLMVRELSAAPFDQRLSILGLLLSRLREECRKVWELDALADALHADLSALKGQLPAVQPDAFLSDKADALRQDLSRRRASGSGDRQGERLVLAHLGRLEELLRHLGEAAPAGSAAAFDLLKADFQADVALRANAAAQVGGHLEQAFAFLENALGEGQELVIFATELTAGTHTSWFIQNFGCEAYYRHNKSLLFNDTQQALLSEIAQVRRGDISGA